MSDKVFCAFCHIPRVVYPKKHVTWTNVLLSIMTSLLLMFIIWQEFNPIVFVIFVVNITFAEVFVQVRWRLSAVCPHCGFDPILYVRDHALACNKVIKVLEGKKESGEFLLTASNPFNNLPKRKLEGLMVPPTNQGKHVSRRI